MKILVIGGTGTVGKLLVDELIDQGADVCVLTRSTARAASVPAPARSYVGDLVEKPEDCEVAFREADSIFMLNAVTSQETVEGLVAVEIARRARISHFVYQSVHGVDSMAHIPHLAPKLVIERAVMGSRMPYSILRPNHFFQNDEACRAALLDHSSFEQPIGPVGCWRVDARDIADAAATVLMNELATGDIYDIVGPALLTSANCAVTWSRVLGREITWIQDVNAWMLKLKTGIPPWLAFDLECMYRHVELHGMSGSASDVARLTGLLGRAPRSYQNYVEERAAAWTRG